MSFAAEYFSMQRLQDKIDLHVAAMLLLFAPAACLGWWGLAVPLLVPQCRIAVRAFVDYPAFKRGSFTYLVANELLVLMSVGLLAGIRVAVFQGV